MEDRRSRVSLSRVFSSSSSSLLSWDTSLPCRVFYYRLSFLFFHWKLESFRIFSVLQKKKRIHRNSPSSASGVWIVRNATKCRMNNILTASRVFSFIPSTSREEEEEERRKKKVRFQHSTLGGRFWFGRRSKKNQREMNVHFSTLHTPHGCSRAEAAMSSREKKELCVFNFKTSNVCHQYFRIFPILEGESCSESCWVGDRTRYHSFLKPIPAFLAGVWMTSRPRVSKRPASRLGNLTSKQSKAIMQWRPIHFPNTH